MPCWHPPRAAALTQVSASSTCASLAAISREGRSSSDWVDFDFHGHQIVAHKVDAAQMTDATSLVDGQQVPVRHFGVVLDLPTDALEAWLAAPDAA